MARSNAVLVPAVSNNNLPNQPQDMYIWPGIVLMAIVPQSGFVKNGVRYEVLSVDGDNQFELAAIHDDGARISDSFIVDKKEMGVELSPHTRPDVLLGTGAHNSWRCSLGADVQQTLHIAPPRPRFGTRATRLRCPGRGLRSAFASRRK